MTADDPSSLQAQARALGDPTRNRIFRHIAAAGQPLSVTELNEHFPYNHNALRQHLAKLVAAGLVVESRRRPSGRGQPPLVYEPAGSAAGQWGGVGPYERLAGLLLEIIGTGRSAVDVGRRA